MANTQVFIHTRLSRAYLALARLSCSTRCFAEHGYAVVDFLSVCDVGVLWSVLNFLKIITQKLA